MRRALCVGIDNYPSAPLRGCVNDAHCMAEVLSTHADGNPNFECRELLAPIGSRTDEITASKLKQEITALFKDSAEVALLHFSGHGTSTNLDGYLVTQDATSFQEGVSLTEVLKLANDSKATEVVIFLDCCYSGRFGQISAHSSAHTSIREGVSILTASRGDQPSVEVGGGGLFTSLVLDSLRGGAASPLGDVTAPAVYALVEAALGAWDQRPLFKAHASKLIALRRCEPAIDRAVIRSLPSLFPVPAETLDLDPEYEPKSAKPNPDKVEVFSKLQALNRINFVVPVDADHMYEAAMQSTGCKLTASGRYYWRLASDRRI